MHNQPYAGRIALGTRKKLLKSGEIRHFNVPTQADIMRAELANLDHCAVLFLSRAIVNLSWYDSIHYS